METNNIFPNNWKEIVRGKKVIFYNTSVASMLSGREKHLEKMKWVFDVFQKHPEVVLWWRPHPLELATIESMMQELRKQYIELREWYKDSQIGILDESGDLNRAIVISDAYYGNWSSVAHLYHAVNKPILYEHDNIFDRHKELFFDVTDFVLIDRHVWFLSSTMNIVFVMDRDTFEVTDAIEIPYGNILEKYMSYRMVVVENYLVLIPGCGNRIIRLDLSQRTFDTLEIGKYGVSIKFGSYAVCKEYLYMLPAFENRILKYDVVQNKIVYEVKLEQKRNGLLLETIMDVTDSYIYAAEAGGSHIYKYDMQNDTFEKIKIAREDIQLFGIKKVKDLFLLILMNKDEILLWDEKENRVWELEGLPKGYSAKTRPFCDLVEYEETIYLFPEQSDKVYKMDMNRMSLEQYYEIAEGERNGGEVCFTRAKNIGEEILAFSHWHNQWVIINPKENTVTKNNAIVQDEILDRIAGYSTVDVDRQGRSHEEDKDFYSLHNYIKDVVRSRVTVQSIEKKKSVGEKIYEGIRNDNTIG